MVSFPVLIFFGIGIKRSQKTIKKKFLNQNTDHNLFGLCLTATCVIVFVLAMDVTAVYFTRSYRNEYKNTDFKTSFNLTVTYATLTLDLLFVAIYFMVTIIIVIYCKLFKRENGRLSICGPSKRLPHTYEAPLAPIGARRLTSSYDPSVKASNSVECNKAPLGPNGAKPLTSSYDPSSMPSQSADGPNEQSPLISNDNSVNVSKCGEASAGARISQDNSKNYTWIRWCLFRLVFVAVACSSTHFGYILVSWLTEPDKTTCIALISIAILLYLYLSFRKTYKEIKEFLYKHESCCVFGTTNILSFIIGIFITALPVMTVTAFWSLPIPALELAVYLENILEIILVFAASLISYKIFSFKQSDAYKFLKKFNECFKDSNDTSQAASLRPHSDGTNERSSVSDKASDENINCDSSDSEEETFEKSGEKVGKLCKIVQDNYTKEKK